MTTRNPAKPDAHHRLVFTVDEPLVARFFLLLQQGVKVRRRIGCSVIAFLREEIGASQEAIERVQSIMLDGKPVDDIGTALVHDGSTLALSAAMPGLVGATLRRGGAYASFRSAITYREAGQGCAAGEGWVSVKVFNLLMAELGTALFRAGVLVETAALLTVLAEHAQEFRQGCAATLDGKPVDVGGLREDMAQAGADEVLLTISSTEGER